MAPTKMAMRIRMTTSWPAMSRRDRFGESDMTSQYDSEPFFLGYGPVNEVRSTVPRGSEVGEIPTLSRNCKWSEVRPCSQVAFREEM